MTALQKLRHHRGVLVGVILFALFAFVLTDVITSKDRISSGSRTTVAVVNGQKLTIDDYRNRTNELMEANKQYKVGYGVASEQVYQSWLAETIVAQQYDLAGVTVSPRGVMNGVLAQPDVRQYFSNEYGMPDEAALRQWVNSVRAEKDQGNAEAEQMWELWEDMKTRGRQWVLGAQYSDMVTAGMTATLLDAKVEYGYKNNQVDGRFAYLPYSSIDDKSIEITDAQINEYIRKHPDEFQRLESRDVQYAVVPVNPSEKDAEEVRSKIAALMEDRVEFNSKTNTTDTIPGFPRVTDDSIYVNANTDAGAHYTGRYAKTFDNQEEAQWVVKARRGDILGPYRDGDSYKLSKLLDVRSMPDSVSMSHILLSYQGNAYVQNATRSKEQAKALADSLASVLKSGRASFAQLAKEYSDDPSAAQNDGSMGWTAYSEGISPEMEQFLFFHPKGSLQVIETPMGYHVFRIDDLKGSSTAYKVATITNFISPSRETAAVALGKAQELASQNASVEEFVAAARKAGYDVVPATDFTVLMTDYPALGDQSQITRWAFGKDVKVGDTKIFDIDGNHVVAILSGMRSEGLESAETARAEVEPILLKEKKAEMLLEKFKQAKGSTVDEIASAAGAQVLEATSLTLATPIIPSAGRAPKAVGVAFGLNVGQVSAPVSDETGVFVATITERREAKPAENYDQVQNELDAQFMTLPQTQFYPALEKKADIEDNRVKIEKLYAGN